MISYATRRTVGVVSVTIISAAFLLIHTLGAVALYNVNFLSGWSLFALMLLLTLFNARKKLPFIPLLSVATWLQFHIYLGLLSLVIFAMHIRFSLPTGTMERVLFALFLIVTASGVAGLILSRWLASRLTRRGEPVLFERIPTILRRLREDVESLILKSATENTSTTLADFYHDHLARFFEAPRNTSQHLLESDRPRHALLSEFAALDRYLNDEERCVHAEITELIKLKDDVDYQYASQAALKYWLFLHIPATYSLIIFSCLHVLLLYAFHGGIR